jgi:hypothetical protein
MKNFLPLLFAALLFSCSRSEPKISFGAIRLVWHATESGTESRYTFFVLPEDDDGYDDLADLYLYHDREGLYWHFSSQEWEALTYEGKIWIGSRDIAMNAGENLPRGQFRAVVIDQGGQKSERSFTFDAPAAARYPFPKFSIAEGQYSTDSKYPSNFVIFYDAQGGTVGVKTILSPEGRVNELAPPNGAFAACLWAEDAEYATSAISKMIPLQ